MISRCLTGLTRAIFWSVLAAASADPAAATEPSAQASDAIPMDPVAQIVRAFESHSIVALGEGAHGNESSHAFRLALIRDRRFSAVADDIVVEFGNSLYQETMDRFVAGDDVPYDELRRVWQDTTQATVIWDVPIYEDFFRAVRSANESLPIDRRLRVILGDVPIRWEQVRTLEDYQRQPARSDEAVAALIQKEVLAKGRRALVIYGEMHLLRRSARNTIVSALEGEAVRAYSIWTNTSADLSKVQPSTAGWPVPSLANIPGTRLGARSLRFYAPANSPDADSVIPLQEQFDAVLYLGPLNSMTYSMLASTLCKDETYLRMRIARLRMSPKTAGGVEQGRQYCARVAPGSENGAAFQ